MKSPTDVPFIRGFSALVIYFKPRVIYSFDRFCGGGESLFVCFLWFYLFVYFLCLSATTVFLLLLFLLFSVYCCLFVIINGAFSLRYFCLNIFFCCCLFFVFSPCSKSVDHFIWGGARPGQTLQINNSRFSPNHIILSVLSTTPSLPTPHPSYNFLVTTSRSNFTTIPSLPISASGA